MNEKFNKSYSRSLSDEQMSVLNQWIVSQGSENQRLLSEVKAIRVNALSEINAYKNMCDNNTLSEKILSVEKHINETTFPSVLGEEHIVKAMTMLQIISELAGEENE